MSAHAAAPDSPSTPPIVPPVPRDDLALSITVYARRRRYSPKSDPLRPPHVPPAVWAAYGDHYPGSPKRAAELDAARADLARRRAKEAEQAESCHATAEEESR